MLTHIKDEFIPLNLRLNQTQNEFDFGIHAVETENLLMPTLLWKSNHWQLVVVVCSWISVLVGSYFRWIMYEHLVDQYKEKKFTPVNKLNLGVALVQHLQQVVVAITMTLMVLNGDSLDQLSGGLWYFFFFINFTVFAISYSCFGSLGVAIYRILLIKQNNWLKYVVGEKLMVKILLFSGIILSVLYVMLQKTHDYHTLKQDTCMIFNKMPIFKLLDEYEQSRGNSSPMSLYIKVSLISLGSLILANLLKIMIYVIFFYDMYKHDNNDNLRLLLEPSVIRYRNRTNATSFFAQFCSFAVELTIVLHFLIAFNFRNRHNMIHTIFMLYWRLQFSAMAMIEVLLSKKLRKRIFNIDLFTIIFGLY